MNELDERKAIGNRLRQAREYLGLSQREAAEVVNIHRPTLCIIEHGKQRCHTLTLLRLAKLYERPVSWFLGEFAPSVEPIFANEFARAFELLTEQDRKAVLDFADFLASKPHGE